MQQVRIAACGVLMFGCAVWGNHDASPTIAEGDGLRITLHELDERVKQSLFDERTRGQANRVYDLRAETLDELIEELVATAEAERLGLSLDALIEARAEAVTEDDVTAFFETNQQRLPEGSVLEDVEDALRAHLEQESRSKVLASMVSAANVVTHLEPPRIEVAAEGPSLGPEAAAITIIEFSDFQCPYCRRAVPVIKELRRRYPQQVRVVYRHLPLEAIHPRARPAAEASACAEGQGHFWEFHDRLFETKAALSASDLRAHAEAIGLDLDAYDGCVTAATYRDDVSADLEAARAAGITSTPAFVINGVLLTGAQPVEAFERLIERELQALAAAP